MRRPPPRLALLLLASGSSATTEWRIAVLPDGRPFAPTDFALAPSPPLDAAALKQGEALFALEYASVDAATRIWTDGGGSAQGWGFFSKLQKRPGDAMFTFGAVLRCLASRHPDWAAGELGVGASAIRAVQVLDPAAARLRKALGSVDPSLELSVLGTTTGLTALLAIEKLLPPRPEGPGVVYVSAAAGGVGLLAAQLFQLRNATRVIGSAGTDEKVRLLRSKYGVEAFNYRRQAVGDALAALAPEGVDVFFDGVGGRTLDEALLHMSKFGTVLNVGAVSEFSSSSRGGLANAHAITDRALRISGFGVANYLTTEETVFGWEEYGAAHTALHAGGSVGKVLVAGPVAAAPRGGGGGGDGGGGGGGGPEAVAELVVRAGASLGRDTAAFAHSLVHDHWVDSVSALRVLQAAQFATFEHTSLWLVRDCDAPVARRLQAPDLIALGLPGRLAAEIVKQAASAGEEAGARLEWRRGAGAGWASAAVSPVPPHGHSTGDGRVSRHRPDSIATAASESSDRRLFWSAVLGLLVAAVGRGRLASAAWSAGCSLLSRVGRGAVPALLASLRHAASAVAAAALALAAAAATAVAVRLRKAVRALLARASSSDGGGSRSDDDRPYTPYSARSRQNRPFAGEAESPSTPVAGAEAAGAKLGAADASAASPAVEAGYGVEAEAEQARAEQSAEQPRHSDDAGARMRASHLWREGRIVAVGNARTPGPAASASRSRSASSSDSGDCRGKASKRENLKRVSKGDPTSYMLASPSMAPSACAEVVKWPSGG
ncbi:hypothetical protein EMIHUDRAFT_462771 [Emiliania huxleyi CCMP1516]|uniref:Enoyl reductase (ER) domain-containing protein n=2 Tax=Emiliania huxleyi TaxID=2903 RepID=A0A0D3K912_EMIH1|nr:hypothetical protein EMIHUDRAFT_462771 [Emiliania huxleyi CCMP1516]EOD32247.1 hypothetical protein EMIHUDRAFT_462771 [Emiliania huxleyi CCMP1516]|eukprot:XP_005784676.1 hypothetical protein EMIHUDRAFT_462771 [Emiliania huxleyi CCMP1516]